VHRNADIAAERRSVSAHLAKSCTVKSTPICFLRRRGRTACALGARASACFWRSHVSPAHPRISALDAALPPVCVVRESSVRFSLVQATPNELCEVAGATRNSRPPRVSGWFVGDTCDCRHHDVVPPRRAATFGGTARAQRREHGRPRRGVVCGGITEIDSAARRLCTLQHANVLGLAAAAECSWGAMVEYETETTPGPLRLIPAMALLRAPSRR
jgi:hypothetical protein